MKLFLIAIFLISFSKTYACSCITLPFDQHYQQSDFIAVAKITYIDSSLHEQDQRDIEIEIITLYKGIAVTKLKIDNYLKSMCGVYTPLNSTWLIFANKNKEGTLSFDYCSRSVQLDPIGNPYFDAQSKSRFDASISRMLKVLDFLKNYQYTFVSETNIMVSEKSRRDSSLNELEEPAYNFAAYELSFEPGQTVHQIQTLKSFQNKLLTETIKEHLQTAKVHSYPKNTQADSAHKLLILFFFYAKEDDYPSFVSRYFL
ncbi:MAG: hypothetical protein IBJ16_02405 [Chitinophagaceae bacterium]|nr:hypothetical protein [Chitinophagaceae bacterium]